MTITDILRIERERSVKAQPSDEELRRIPLERPGRLLGRLSSPGQVQNSAESMAEYARLVEQARRDGFPIELSDQEIEGLLAALQEGASDATRYWRGAQFVIDLRDLGRSGRLGPDKRPALAELMADLSRGEAGDVTGSIYLSSEGVSRLSRDQDRVVGYQLLKLMKEANCRVRTPYGVLNPRIEVDWKELAEGFEDAAKESKRLYERHFGPKIREKAERGEHVGAPVPPGFIVEIAGYKSNGSYIFGKWQAYPPHAEVDTRALQEYVRHNGSEYQAAQALRGVVFPYFPEELKYMRTRSSLHRCLQNEHGYLISPDVIDGLARQVALIGVWKWSDILIEGNHPNIAPLDLFAEAYALANRPGARPRGRAAYFEPLDWADLLWCLNHDTPRRISPHSSEGKWVCDRDYHNGTGPTCLKIDHRVISEPLTEEFLRCLDLTSHAEAVLQELQGQADVGRLEEARRKREEARLTTLLRNLENYLGSSDPELEESYCRRIREAKADLQALRQRPLPSPATDVDILVVRHFLENLGAEWKKLSPTLRNRLLKLVVDRVEVTHDLHRIVATVIWKIGFSQTVEIQRPVGSSRRDRHWTEDQDALLRMLWPDSSQDVLLAAFSTRTWQGIKTRANRLRLERRMPRAYPSHWHPWTAEDDARLSTLYLGETPIDQIAIQLGRSKQAVMSRASMLGTTRPQEIRYRMPPLVWEVKKYDGFKGECPWPQPTPDVGGWRNRRQTSDTGTMSACRGYGSSNTASSPPSASG